MRNRGSSATISTPAKAMEARRQSTPTTTPRQTLGDVTNRNAYSLRLRSGTKLPKPKPKSPKWEEIAPHFCSAESSTGSVGVLFQGGDRPPESFPDVASGSTRQSDSSLGKRRKSAIPEDYDEKVRNGKMMKKKRKKEKLMMAKKKKKKNEAIIVGSCNHPSSGDIRSNSETTPDPLSEHNMEKYEMDPELKKMSDYYADIDAYELIEEIITNSDRDSD